MLLHFGGPIFQKTAVNSPFRKIRFIEKHQIIDTQPNLFGKLKAIKFDETELAWLTTEQIKRLMNELENSTNPSAVVVARICLAIGARWGEAEGLTGSQVRDGRITFSKTKSGKTRSAPYSDTVIKNIRSRGSFSRVAQAHLGKR
jgi:integrase